MEMAKLILDFVLEHEGEDEFLPTIQIAKKLADGLSDWDAKEDLKVIFGGEKNAQ